MYDTITPPIAPRHGTCLRRAAVEVLRRRFRVTTWSRGDAGADIITLTDPATGDTLTVAVLDEPEVSDPHTLLTCTRNGVLSTHGPFDGDRQARNYAHALSSTDPSLAVSRTVTPQPPELATPALDAWRPLPSSLLLRARPDTTDTPYGALVLRDPHHRLVAAIGPWSAPTDADTWRPHIPLPPGVQRLYVGLRPAHATLVRP